MQSFYAPVQPHEFIPSQAVNATAINPYYLANNPLQRITICHGIISFNCIELLKILDMLAAVENQRNAVLEEGKQYYQDMIKLDPKSKDKKSEDWWRLQFQPIALPALISPQISTHSTSIYNELILIAITQTQVTEYQGLCATLEVMNTSLDSLKKELEKLRSLLIETLHKHLSVSTAPKASPAPQPQRAVKLSSQRFFVGTVISEDAELVDNTASPVTGSKRPNLTVDTELANNTNKNRCG